MNTLPDTLLKDADGMESYEYLVNHIDLDAATLDAVVDNINRVDNTGQFLASSARFLAAIDCRAYAHVIEKLVKFTIEKDRKHAYLPSLLQTIWGEDYERHIEELRATDDNFRRIYKRLYPSGSM